MACRWIGSRKSASSIRTFTGEEAPRPVPLIDAPAGRHHRRPPGAARARSSACGSADADGHRAFDRVVDPRYALLTISSRTLESRDSQTLPEDSGRGAVAGDAEGANVVER